MGNVTLIYPHPASKCSDREKNLPSDEMTASRPPPRVLRQRLGIRIAKDNGI